MEHNCNGSCASCGGCRAALELTAPELELLRELGMYAFLPVARTADDITPHYLPEDGRAQTDIPAALLHLERKGLIDLDYGAPIGMYDDPGYAPYPVRGSAALTARGQRVLEELDIRGIAP